MTTGLSRTVSVINGDLSRKSPIFPARVFKAPAAWEFGSGAGVRKNWNDGLPKSKTKKF